MAADPPTATRFLVACEFDEDKAAKALARHVHWLALQGGPAAGLQVPPPPHLVWRVDGSRFAMWGGAFEARHVAWLDRNAAAVGEAVLARMRETRHVGGVSVIVDVRRTSLGQVVGPEFLGQFQAMSKTFTSNYPELLKEVFLVAPPVGGATFVELMVSMLHGKLPAKTLAKVVVVHGGVDELVNKYGWSRALMESWLNRDGGATTEEEGHVSCSLWQSAASTTTTATATEPPLEPEDHHNSTLLDALVDSLRALLAKAEEVERETLTENQRLRKLLVSLQYPSAPPPPSSPRSSSLHAELAALQDEVQGLHRSVEFARNFIDMQEDTIVRESRDLERAVSAITRENTLLRGELERAFGKDAPTYFLDDFKRV